MALNTLQEISPLSPTSATPRFGATHPTLSWLNTATSGVSGPWKSGDAFQGDGTDDGSARDISALLQQFSNPNSASGAPSSDQFDPLAMASAGGSGTIRAETPVEELIGNTPTYVGTAEQLGLAGGFNDMPSLSPGQTVVLPDGESVSWDGSGPVTIQQA